ncbi:hypothetical protein [Leucobacter denitrificans]|uniref:Uncharacterized protein n=1 Tax=Leucobacter denitrificans TaxID=683042 RepID=A0A7G9S3T8_9MICO|nr:hypothetical protein [Leucobacter denitrificans]QNN62513.1 hypothetical protein H9L06_09715 [Leucobacter denitrificans]
MNTEPLTPPEPEQYGEAPTPPAPPATEAANTVPTTPMPEQRAAAATDSTAAAPLAADSKRTTKPTPRTSPIVWGSLILVFCAYVFVRTEGWSVDTTTWLITTIIGVGALLLVVGIAVLLRNSRQNR